MVIDKQTMKATLTVSELQNVLVFLNGIDQNRKNKLTYAATQLGDEIQAKLKPYAKAEQKITVEFAAKKEDGDFKLSEKGDFMVDPKRFIDWQVKKEELAETTTVELDLYYCRDKELISALPVVHIKKLNGLLFDYDLSELETEQSVSQKPYQA